jgi:transposase
MRRAIWRTGGCAAAAAAVLTAQSLAAQTKGVPPIIVSATRPPIEAERYPGMATVLSGEGLRARGATDLRTALSLVAGVDAPPGGDAGPGGAVPALWGLQEFDAFLLIVDGVPYGGAFNPALPVLDLRGVERIEVLRGAAPVTYGATSFVGVIQVFHYGAGQTPDEVGVAGGNPRQATAYAEIDLPGLGKFAQSMSFTAERKGFAQARSELSRLHALYRLAGATALGALHLDLEAVSLRQNPYSPHPREGAALSPRFPFDANINPLDAKADQERAQANIGLASDLGFAHWETTLSGAHTLSRNTRGFLRDGFATNGVTPNADGFRQRVHQSDSYFDSHISIPMTSSLITTLGADWSYGRGVQRSANFEYAVLPSGANARASSDLPTDEFTRSYDRRNFYGLYGSAIWSPDSHLLLSAGLRLNHTRETRAGSVDPTDPLDLADSSGEAKSKWRSSGALGASYALWHEPSGETHDNRPCSVLLSALLPQSMLLADRGYGADWIREFARQRAAWANIPPKRNRKDPICFIPFLYRARNLIERFFSRIKQCRRVATQYDKLAASYLAFIKLALIHIWLRANESTP